MFTSYIVYIGFIFLCKCEIAKKNLKKKRKKIKIDLDGYMPLEWLYVLIRLEKLDVLYVVILVLFVFNKKCSYK